MRTFPLLLTLALVGTATLPAQTTADSAGIRAAALDYAEGWFEGNADRMARAVSPELVKRIVVRDTVSGKDMIMGMGSTVLVNNVRRGFGKNTPADKQQKEVRIYDIYRGAAVARVTMTDWIDYLQLARVDGRWVIVNVLWERKSGPEH
jgi:putative lumazine-binding protein